MSRPSSPFVRFSVLASLIAGALALSAGCASAADAEEESAGTEALTTLTDFRTGGSFTEADLYARSRGGALGDRIDFLRPVLKGVLYRGGFNGGDPNRSGLGALTKNFCEQGFSAGRYIDFSTSRTELGTTTCAGGSFDYEAGRASQPAEIMSALHAIIKEKRGPMFVHCMWGVHSSGAVSAMALVQFCGWSETRAKAYWDKARNNATCAGGCDTWIDDRFASFKVNPDLAITAEEQAEICPQ